MIQAVDDKIIVELLRRSKTSGGLIVPETVMDPQGYGKILSMGADVPDTVAIDDILVFHIRAGMDMLMDKALLKCLKYEEVYGKLTDESMLSQLTPYEIKDEEVSSIIT